MAWPLGTINLPAARAVFEDVEFSERFIGSSVVGYQAIYKGNTYEHESITKLCKLIWKLK
jgi:hypothetical protein